MTKALTVDSAADPEVTGLIERVIADVPPPRSRAVDHPDRAAAEVRVWRSQGGGALSASAAYPGTSPLYRLVAGDLDRDGDTDLVAQAYSSARMVVLENAPMGSSRDCDRDSIPDECETDCNGSGLPDACDLAWAISSDCDRNGAPDDCDPDCDGDGIPDLAVGAPWDDDEENHGTACWHERCSSWRSLQRRGLQGRSTRWKQVRRRAHWRIPHFVE